MRDFLIALIGLLLASALFPITAQGQGIYDSFVTFGAQGGMQEQDEEWVGYFQLFTDVGPEHSAQLRLAVRTALFNNIVPTSFLTGIIFNIGTAFQRFYVGAGLSVPIRSINSRGPEIQALALFGLRAPPTPHVIAAIEGGLIAPFDFSERPKMFISLGFSIPI